MLVHFDKPPLGARYCGHSQGADRYGFGSHRYGSTIFAVAAMSRKRPLTPNERARDTAYDDFTAYLCEFTELKGVAVELLAIISAYADPCFSRAVTNGRALGWRRIAVHCLNRQGECRWCGRTNTAEAPMSALCASIQPF
jgi:hypothetical protein